MLVYLLQVSLFLGDIVADIPVFPYHLVILSVLVLDPGQIHLMIDLAVGIQGLQLPLQHYLAVTLDMAIDIGHVEEGFLVGYHLLRQLLDADTPQYLLGCRPLVIVQGTVLDGHKAQPVPIHVRENIGQGTDYVPAPVLAGGGQSDVVVLVAG